MIFYMLVLIATADCNGISTALLCKLLFVVIRQMWLTAGANCKALLGQGQPGLMS